jgi:UDP-glucose 4-epimerase
MENAMTKRIVFTGGTGKAGRYAVPHLLGKGYSILNVDLKPLDLPGVNTLVADLTDSGQAFNALTTHFGLPRYMNATSSEMRAACCMLCVTMTTQ